MTARGIIMLTAVAGLVAGCGFSGIGSGDSGLFGPSGVRGSSEQVRGIRFRSRLSVTSEDDRSFAVSTAGAGRGISGAIEAGRVEAVRYCLNRFGGSEISWTYGPEQDAETIRLDDRGALVMTGQCIAR
ncbi:hypothetical protein [Jannaschia sp. 2305UL9-9]|uniref:hypothetical protein n=1 Tax=Jannaschia sp. 2305UL9-9 TaxID=3121638 RepID=UPI003529D3B5